MIRYNKTAYLEVVGNSETYPKDRTWTTASASIACLLQPLNGNDVFINGKRTIIATQKVFCRSGEAMTEDDRLLIDSTRYDIVFVKNPNNFDHHLEVFCKEAEGA